MSNYNWDFPYLSQRMPVFARNMVATSQPLAVQAGLGILHRGGNAADAAALGIGGRAPNRIHGGDSGHR